LLLEKITEKKQKGFPFLREAGKLDFKIESDSSEGSPKSKSSDGGEPGKAYFIVMTLF
jgi:hypothetical protein